MGKQLWLDNAGATPVEVADFEEHDVQHPMEQQLDPEMPGEAWAVWLCMRGVGKRAHASRKLYAERLGWSEDRVSKWQKVAETAKWMVLLAEGKSGAEGQPGTPRLWWMCRTKGEVPPLTAFQEGPENHPPIGVAKSPPPKNHPPKHSSSSNSSSQSKNLAAKAAAVPRGTKRAAEKPPYATTDQHSSQQLVEAWALAWAWWKVQQRTPQALKPTTLDELPKVEKDDLQAHIGKGARALHTLGKRASFTMDEFTARADNMRNHKFHHQQDCSLTYFCSHYPEFANGSQALKTSHRGGYSVQHAEPRREGED